MRRRALRTRPAARCVASLAIPGQPRDVAGAVGRACSAGRGAVALLLARALGGLHDAAAAPAAAAGTADARREGAAEDVALAEGIDAPASLCGA